MKISRVCEVARLFAVAVMLSGTEQVFAETPASLAGRTFDAQDSLGTPMDTNADAQQCLAGLCWKVESFRVSCQAAREEDVSLTVRFPSPKPIGHEQSDQVAIEWYAVVDEQGELKKGPAVVVIHESGSGMTVGRIVSKGLRERGIHALMVQLPFYGLRRPAGERPENQNLGHLLGQGIADARRAQDAVKVLPGIDVERVSLLGISLGGFVSATCAGLDDSFEHVFILLAGGNLPKLVETGEREAAQLRERLAAQGYTGDRLFELLNRVEPNRLAHRISRDRLWVYSATMDTVVPPEHCEAFARAAGLDESHLIKLPATHYSGILLMPGILEQVAEQVRE